MTLAGCPGTPETLRDFSYLSFLLSLLRKFSVLFFHGKNGKHRRRIVSRELTTQTQHHSMMQSTSTRCSCQPCTLYMREPKIISRNDYSSATRGLASVFQPALGSKTKRRTETPTKSHETSPNNFKPCSAVHFFVHLLFF